jgi:hypothetical protein
VHGNENSQTYPSGLFVSFAPNALGQPTKAGTYASRVTYHPNGGMSCFNYANSVVHRMWQNARQLPDRSIDMPVAALDPNSCLKAAAPTAILDDSYDYDFNGNVMAITDAAVGSGASRDMTYDGLDRLLTTAAPGLSWLNAQYTYDPRRRPPAFE